MKRNLVWAAALVVLAACSDEVELLSGNGADNNDGQKVMVTATLPSNGSRVILQDVTENGKNIIKVDWKESGESFSVMTTVPFFVNSEAKDKQHVFAQTEGENFEGTKPQKIDNEPYYAFYPALDLWTPWNEDDEENEGEYNLYDDDDKCEITSLQAAKIPFDFSVQSGELDENNTLMYAQSYDGTSFDFQHLTAIVKFTLSGFPETFTEAPVVIYWEDGGTTNGIFDLRGGSVESIYPESNGGYIEITAPVVDGTATFYAYLPPVAAGAVLEIGSMSSDDNYNYVHMAKVELADDKSIEAGKFYRVARTMENYVDPVCRHMTAGNVEELQAWVDLNREWYNISLTLTDNIDLSQADLDGDPDNDSNWPGYLLLEGAVFDGAGYTIKGIRMNTEWDAAALFEDIDEFSTVKNLHLSDVSLTCTDYYAAGIVGRNNGTVSGCSVSGIIDEQACNYPAGGIVALNEPTGVVTACYSSASVTSAYAAGGVVGHTHGSVTACYSTSTVNANEDAGGVAATQYFDGSVSACYWSGNNTNGVGWYETEAGPSNAGTTKIIDTDWSGAMAGMNAVLTDFGWKYVANTDDATKATFPLVLQKK